MSHRPLRFYKLPVEQFDYHTCGISMTAEIDLPTDGLQEYGYLIGWNAVVKRIVSSAFSMLIWTIYNNRARVLESRPSSPTGK